MPCKRLQPSYRPCANSLTLVPTGTSEYITAGDSQVAVPFPTEIGRDFDLQWKMASGLSYLLLQLAITAGKQAFRKRVLWRPHPARREVTCGDTDMDWPRLGAVLHTTGLWGRSYLGVGRRAASRTWQKLCQREDMGLLWGKPYHGRIHIWDYPKGNQAIRTPSPVQELTRDPGELTPVLGLASDCSAQSDCRGCLEDSTRVHRPGNWTGGEKRRPYPRVRGNGAASVTPASSSHPLTCYPTHGKKLAQRGECRILRMCSVLPSPQLCRCLPKRRHAPTQRDQHGWQQRVPILSERKGEIATKSCSYAHNRRISHPRTHLQRVGSPDTENNDRVLHPQTGNDCNQKDTDETAFWKRRNRP